MVCCAPWLGFWQIRGKRRKSEFFSLLLVLQPSLRAGEHFTVVLGHARSPYALATLTPECIARLLLCHLVPGTVSCICLSKLPWLRSHVGIGQHSLVPSTFTGTGESQWTELAHKHSHVYNHRDSYSPRTHATSLFVFCRFCFCTTSRWADINSLLNNKYTHRLSPWHFSLCPSRQPLSSTHGIRPLLLHQFVSSQFTHLSSKNTKHLLILTF